MTYHLKTRIAVAVSIMTMVFVLLISWVAHLYFEKEFKSTASSYLSDTLAVTAQDLSNRTLQVLHVLEVVRNSITAEIMNDPQEMQQFLDGLNTEKLIFDNGIGIFSIDGTLQAITPRQDDILGMDFSFRDYIKVTILNRQPYISAPIKARQKHHHPIIMFTEPIFNKHDEIIGILAGSLDLHGNNFLQALINSKLGNNGYYMMLDQQETLLIHPNKDHILRQASDFFPQPQINEFLVNSRGLIPQIVINGQKMIGAFQHISPLNWTLVALTPLTEIYQPIVQARIYTMAALTALFALVIVTVRILTNKLTLPLTELSEEISQLASSDNLSVEFKSEPYKELGALAKPIQFLVNDLGNKRKNLKDQLIFLQNLIDTIPGPIFYKGRDFRYLGCNKAFEEYIGIKRHDLIGKSTFDIAPAEFAAVYQNADAELWEQGGEQVYETSVKYADGTIHDVIFYKKIFNDTHENPAGMIGTFLDITDRKRSEKALQASEQRFRLLVENAADAFFLHDAEGQVLDVNQQACNSLGYNREELLKLSVTDISVDYDINQVKQLQRHLLDEHILTVEDQHRRKDGSLFPVEVRLCYTDQHGGMIIALARDITERKHHEAMLQNALIDSRAAREQVDNILRSAADGIVVTNRRNRITHLNQVAEEIIGVSAQDIIGHPFTALFTNKALREQAREFLNVDSHDTHQVDFRLNLSDSALPRIVQARSSILYTDEGQRSGVVTLLRDVSRERELDQLKSEFISTAAHEMRTPMSVIMGYIEILRDRENFGGVTKNQEKKFLEEAYNKGEALSRIIDDLFDISRIEAGLPLPIDKSECNLNEIIENITSHYSQHSPKHTFKVDLEHPAIILADPNKMTQAFENIISNAVKYSPAGGVIKVTSERVDDDFNICIEDQGNGMTNEQLERIFDKFYRADYSNTAITGLGLGMSIVKKILEVHDGKIDIKSSLGKGTCVKLQIPAIGRE